jgi:hypothetical protein
VKLGLGLGELCEMVGFSLPEISREEAQKSESEFVTEATEGGHSVENSERLKTWNDELKKF